MNPRSRFLLIAMSTVFAICICGVLADMLYYLGAVYFAHRTLESVMGGSIRFNEILGALGILGMLFFFAFLFSLMAGKTSKISR